MVEVKDFASSHRPTWCPGCGNFGIWNALKMALADLDLAPHQVMLVGGIGCGSKLPDYTHANGFMSIHGRPVPVATGMKLANHGMKVICTHGDGDGLGQGLGHLLHAARRNIGLVDIIQDNRIYGLTKGQYSPTTERGRVTKTSPEGTLETPVNPLMQALTAGATFVARSWSGDVKHLSSIIARAVQHRGYALIDVLQPCVTFNRAFDYDFYRPRVFQVEGEPGYSATDRDVAWKQAQEWGERIPIGVFYQVEDQPAYEAQVAALEEGPLAGQSFRAWSEADYHALREEYM
ncbi:MAG: 2-oxoacid ferredoxin oxidoreductase [Chloroflexi bacterium]|nr:2-oxoacid ferredoxin oxidoreductase [Chloroflexota bacterium]